MCPVACPGLLDIQGQGLYSRVLDGAKDLVLNSEFAILHCACFFFFYFGHFVFDSGHIFSK